MAGLKGNAISLCEWGIVHSEQRLQQRCFINSLIFKANAALIRYKDNIVGYSWPVCILSATFNSAPNMNNWNNHIIPGHRLKSKDLNNNHMVDEIDAAKKKYP